MEMQTKGGILTSGGKGELSGKEAVKIAPQVRTFRLEDIDKILDIEAQAFPKTRYSKEIFLTYAKLLPDSFIVAEIGEDIAGYLIFDPNGHVHSTAVKATQRKKGLGRMMFMYASRHAKARLWLEVRSKNKDAIRFYEELGMKVIGKVPGYYDSDDALLMVLDQGGQGKDWENDARRDRGMRRH